MGKTNATEKKRFARLHSCRSQDFRRPVSQGLPVAVHAPKHGSDLHALRPYKREALAAVVSSKTLERIEGSS